MKRATPRSDCDPARRAALRRLAAAAACLTLGAKAAPGQAAPTPGEFLIGVLPHTSSRVIIANYQPIRAVVERIVAQPTEIVTAPSFTAFLRRAFTQDFDLAVVSSSMAELLRSQRGYLPLLVDTSPFRVVVLVARDATAVTGPSDLTGGVVLGLDPAALSTQWGEDWLARHRVVPSEMRYINAGDSIADLVARGAARGGFVSSPVLASLPAALQAKVRVLAESPLLPGRVTVLNRRHLAQAEAIRGGLLAFAASAEGRRHFTETGLGGYRALDPSELAEMAPLGQRLLRLIPATEGTR
jgi:phosphonate transport system substrate-binding protein